MELFWDLRNSPSLSEEQRARLEEKLSTRLDGDGTLRLVEGGSRSQHQNREAVTERFRALLEEALRIPKPRRKTRPPRAAKEARLQSKKRRSEVKRARGRVEPE